MAEANAVLLVVAGAFIVAPFVYMVLIEAQLRRFQSETFGRFRRAAVFLRLAVAAIFCYYVAMVAWLFFTGRVHRMVEWVISVDGLQLYLRVGGATLAFALHWLVAMNLYRIVRPAEPASSVAVEELV